MFQSAFRRLFFFEALSIYKYEAEITSVKFFDAASAVEYNAAGMGFEKISVIGVGTVVFFAEGVGRLHSFHGASGKISILSSPDPEALRLAARRFDALHSVNFLADPAFIREAAERGVPFEIPFRLFLERTGVERARLFHRARFFLRVCIKHGADFFFTSRAESVLEARSPSEIASVAEAALGLSRDQALRALSAVPKKLIEEARVEK